jgi:hypothetical protein
MAIEQAFPHLLSSGYSVTSAATEDYNCIAWAAGEEDRWWWPDAFGTAYWPENVPRVETLEAFVSAYITLGYQPCESAVWEPGYEKVAIYVDASGMPTHASRQLPSGEWSSKLGSWEDITHGSLEGISGRLYGQVRQILKRPML